MAIIFDGNKLAKELRQDLAVKVREWRKNSGKSIKIKAIVFEEDPGGMLYTRKKQEAAQEVGIEYEPDYFSLGEETAVIETKIRKLNTESGVTGIIIQKPARRIYEEFQRIHKGEEMVISIDAKSDSLKREPKLSFNEWWQILVGNLTKEKDVDGLSPATMAAIAGGTWQVEGRVLPATVRAVLKVLAVAENELPAGSLEPDRGAKMIILGKSDLLGYPLAGVARGLGYEVELLGKKELEEKLRSSLGLKEAKIIVSATGVAGLVKGEMVAEGAVLVDVGEPQGDLEWASCMKKAAFLTPVPGGVGPLTVISLLENSLQLAKASRWSQLGG